MAKLGGWIFIVGLLLSAIIAVFSAALVPMWAIYTIAIIGLFVGLMNIQEGEELHFMVSSLIFLLSFQTLSSVFSALALGWQAVATFFQLVSIFVAFAAAVVAIKGLFVLAKD